MHYLTISQERLICRPGTVKFRMLTLDGTWRVAAEIICGPRPWASSVEQRL
jgi:hypothetical protein